MIILETFTKLRLKVKPCVQWFVETDANVDRVRELTQVIYVTVNYMEIRQRLIHSACCCGFFFIILFYRGRQLGRQSY